MFIYFHSIASFNGCDFCNYFFSVWCYFFSIYQSIFFSLTLSLRPFFIFLFCFWFSSTSIILLISSFPSQHPRQVVSLYFSYYCLPSPYSTPPPFFLTSAFYSSIFLQRFCLISSINTFKDFFHSLPHPVLCHATARSLTSLSLSPFIFPVVSFFCCNHCNSALPYMTMYLFALVISFLNLRDLPAASLPLTSSSLEY